MIELNEIELKHSFGNPTKTFLYPSTTKTGLKVNCARIFSLEFQNKLTREMLNTSNVNDFPSEPHLNLTVSLTTSTKMFCLHFANPPPSN